MVYRLSMTALLIGSAFYLGMACQPPRIVTHEVLVMVDRPTYLPSPKSAKVRKSVDVLSAAIPASALQWKGK
jgi:hypothetical protein